MAVLVIGSVIAIASMASSFAQQGPPDRTLVAQTRPVSPSVLATLLTRERNIELIVLWRGGPGWFGRGDHAGSSGGSGAHGALTTRLDYGGIKLALVYNDRTRTATVQGRTVPLADNANVILVDGVDAAGGPTSIERAVLNTWLDSPNPTLASVFSRSPEVVAFLRCDVGTQSEIATRMVNQLVCDELKRE
jgi:hypothetical protein